MLGPLVASALGVVAVLGAGLLPYRLALSAQVTPTPSPEKAPDAEFLALVPDHAPSKGGEGAPSILIEFSDLECPWCAVTHAAISRMAAQAGPDRVRVRFVHYPLDTACNPFVTECVHRTACASARAALCASEAGRFWDYADRLYANRERHQPEDLARLALDLGLDPVLFEACLVDPATARRLDEDIRFAHSMGVRATPTTIVNGVRVEGAMQTDQLVELLGRTEICSCSLRREACGCREGASSCGCEVQVAEQPACHGTDADPAGGNP